MDLMKYPPKPVLVSESMPPVKNKGANKPNNKTLSERKVTALKCYKRGDTEKINLRRPPYRLQTVTFERPIIMK